MIHNTNAATIKRTAVINIMAPDEFFEMPSCESLTHIRRYPIMA